MEQKTFTENGYEIDKVAILSDKNLVMHFFGDNREWYKKLQHGGSTYGKVSLDSQEFFEEDNDDAIDGEALPPLDSERITEARADSIASFFREYKEACGLFLEYQKGYNQEK
jgi:hypothetical protein